MGDRDADVVVYRRADGLWDWRLIAVNGEQLCESSQGYTERNDAVEAVARVGRVFGGTYSVRFDAEEGS